MPFHEGRLRAMDEKRTAVVTAAGGPMGAAIARRLAVAGWRVMCGDRRAGSMEWLAAELDACSTLAGVVHADLSTREGTHNLLGHCLDSWGRIDGLVNVVGGVKGPLNQPLWEITPEQWAGTVRLNLDSAFHCMAEALPTMMARRSGHIVNIGSTSWAGSPERAHYAAAKAGLVALTRSAATQLGPFGITVNLVAPSDTRRRCSRCSCSTGKSAPEREVRPSRKPGRSRPASSAMPTRPATGFTSRCPRTGRAGAPRTSDESYRSTGVRR
jgi:NAD(P)-dependent dehydrogenase (short-subunit alcohol dehydrogenase family)